MLPWRAPGIPEQASPYTILRYLALVSPARGLAPRIVDDERSIQIAISADASRLADKEPQSLLGVAPGHFVQRDVTVGDTMGNEIAISSGVEPGDAVVTEGAFFLRSEADRVGVR